MSIRNQAHQLFVQGKVEAAIAEMCAMISDPTGQFDTDDWKFLSFLYSSAGDYLDALGLMEEVYAKTPDDQENLKNMGVCCLRLGRLEEAQAWLHRALSLDDRDFQTRDALAHVFGKLGNRKIAQLHGERALQLKDEAAASLTPLRSLEGVDVPPFNRDRPNRNIIAFSLWGTQYRYISGAIENARLAAEIYPDWRCRFYCGPTVPSWVIGDLLSHGSDAILMPEDGRLYEGLFWRFQVCGDKSLDRYIIRDADSLINPRERAAVEDWIASDKHFHVIRDFYTHTDPILAGLWGGVRGALPDLRSIFRRYLNEFGKTKNCDQKLLREIVWPVARQSCTIHDSWFRVLGARPFPLGATLGKGRHVGQNAEFHPKPKSGQMFRTGRGGRIERQSPRQRLIFTITTGRSGTSFLAKLLQENLPEAEVHHERLGYHNIGVHSPDASHFTLFNSVGNVPQVREFWKRKLKTVQYGPGMTYAETSHFLAKAGLVENLRVLGPETLVHIVFLKRNLEDLVWSFANRMDFANLGFTWLFALDPRYPRNIVDYSLLKDYGMFGLCYWYVIEMLARGEYYRRLVDDWETVRFHDVSLESLTHPKGARKLLVALGAQRPLRSLSMPDKQNASKQWVLGEDQRNTIREMLARVRFDPADLAASCIKSGHRLR